MIENPQLKCSRCGHTWVPYKPSGPKYCRGCGSPYWDQPVLTDIERFEQLFVKKSPDECWVWIGSITGHGYGYFGIQGRRTQAHRASWEFYRSPIPPKLYVLHECDNPPCVNPNHLFLGTYKDNALDAVKKGRMHHATGIKNGMAKLDEGDIAKIRADNRMLKIIAGDYGVCLHTIFRAKHRHNWKHI